MERTTKSGAPQKTGKPRIDTAKIPEWTRLSIASAIYKAVLQDMKRPDFQEGFERWMVERNAASEASDA